MFIGDLYSWHKNLKFFDHFIRYSGNTIKTFYSTVERIHLVDDGRNEEDYKSIYFKVQ